MLNSASKSMITLRQVDYFVRKHLSDVHAQNAIILPAYAIIEVTKNHLTSDQSLDTRVAAYKSGLLGVGLAYGWGNDMARRGVAQLGRTSKLAEDITDTVYAGIFFYGYSLALYTYAAKLPFDEANSDALIGAAMGVALGSTVGRATNMFRDAFSIDNPHGKTTFLRGAPLKKRLTAVAITAALALGTAAATYRIKNHYDAAHTTPATTLERVVER